MKIIKDSTVVSLDNLIKENEILLKKEKCLIISSEDHLDHIAAYAAWKSAGGNIAIINPKLPAKHREILVEKINKKELNDNILFHTSGSTGVPKLVIHNEMQMLQAQKASENAIGWDNNTNWLNLIPAPTSGFWHIVIPALYHNNSNIVLSSPQTLAQDIKQHVNEAVFVPGLIDILVSKGINFSLGKFNKISVGASQVQKRHAEYVFKNGCKIFNHCYGTTEICAPVLHRYAYDVDDSPEFLELTPMCENEYRIKDNELQVKGKSICENVNEFDADDGWYKTNDLWEQRGNLIKFYGRSNDVIKINGCQCSLLEIENVFENVFKAGECLAIPRQTRGVEWIELQYTSEFQHNKLIVKELLPQYAIPKKFVKIAQLARTSLGKKIRG